MVMSSFGAAVPIAHGALVSGVASPAPRAQGAMVRIAPFGAFSGFRKVSDGGVRST
jgi:hypothetical protein